MRIPWVVRVTFLLSVALPAVFFLSTKYGPADTTRIAFAGGADREVVVKVSAGRVLHGVSDRLLGEGVWAGYQAYGWDLERARIYPEAEKLIAQLKMGVLGHYPGVGVVTHDFHWKDVIGPLNARKDPTPRQETFDTARSSAFGPDEYGQFLEQYRRLTHSGVEGSIQVNIVNGTAEEAADWVEYMNAPADGSNPNGGKDWGKERAANGHRDPYRIKYWEFGNEPHFTAAQIGHLTAEEYVERIRSFSRAMKTADPSIEVMGYVNPFTAGSADAIGTASRDLEVEGGMSWTQKVIRDAGESLDCLYFHWYGGWNDRRTSYEFVMSSMYKGLIPWLDRLQDDVKRFAPSEAARERLRRVMIPEWHVYGGWSKPIAGGSAMLGAVAMSRTLHVMVGRPEIEAAQRLALLAPYPKPNFRADSGRRRLGARLFGSMFDVREGYFAIQAREDGSAFFGTALYVVKKLWSRALQGRLLAVELEKAPRFDNGVPAVDVSAFLSDDAKTLSLLVTNAAVLPQEFKIAITDFRPREKATILEVSGRPRDNNSWSYPERIRMSESDIAIEPDSVRVRVPPSSVAGLILRSK